MGFARGAACLLRGLRLWRQRPRLMAFGLIPAILVAAVIGVLLVMLVLVADDLVAWATPFAGDWSEGARGLFRGALVVIVLIGAVGLSIVTFTGLTLAVGDPFYERIWKEVELSLGGEVPDHGVGWLRGARDGLVLVGLGLATAVGVFLLGLLPVVGTVVGAVAGLLVAGRLLAGELVSRPLAARGMDRAARRALLRRHRRALLGFGVCVQACCLVPLGAILVMPSAVAGATYLAREALGDATDPA